MTVTPDPVRHRANCTRHDSHETVGALGDALVKCRTCLRFIMAGTIRAQAARNPFARPLPRPVAPVEPREVLPMPRPSRVRPAASVAPVAPTPAPTPAPVPLVTRWRCGNHPDVPVTWRGTGCPECASDHAARQRDREHAARERRECAERERLR